MNFNPTIKIKCPKCEFSFKIKLVSAQKQETVICSGCLSEIKLVDKDKSVDNSIKHINESLNNLFKSIKL